MSRTPHNLFEDIPDVLPGELVQTLLDGSQVRIERIVSRGDASPDGFWYDQQQSEWVLLLTGRARLRFEGHDAIELTPGSFLNIPARTRHRVDWTDPAEPTVWLAVHY
ncbi:MAG TPA: cupin domain-containing protein [Tepidisphaeraceae bacterium]|jgi:cupin 2 domain-containing protein|nr:cupin domain-containing protein [Tepidisphaeraceae bacterium]